jgi:hypothetical protein
MDNYYNLAQKVMYSPHSILVAADLDVSRHILCIDTSVSATTNMEQLEYVISVIVSPNFELQV